jgi:DNA mismatch repair ATPase MutL
LSYTVGVLKQDNGRGIAVDGRSLLCSANATSKISTFEDIYSVEASKGGYGFRGEALHLMGQACNELIITTRTAIDTMAERIRVVNGERQDSEVS